MKRYGAKGFKPGDVIITNHQAVAGQHLNNVVIYMPYFHKGELLMFSMVRAHWIDIGGSSTGFGAGPSVIDPWFEGLQLDQLKIYREGVLDETLYRVLKDNIRFPEILARRHEIADGRLPAGGAAHGRAVREIRPRHHPRRHRPHLRRDRKEVPQRGRRACRRRLRGVRRHGRRRRAARRAGADPRQGHHRQRRDDHRPFRLLARAQGRDQFAHPGRRPRRLQGADRSARPGQRRLVPRART